MRKTLCFVFFLLIVSCNNKETLTITPKLEKELYEQVYLNKPIK